MPKWKRNNQDNSPTHLKQKRVDNYSNHPHLKTNLKTLCIIPTNGQPFKETHARLSCHQIAQAKGSETTHFKQGIIHLSKDNHETAFTSPTGLIEFQKMASTQAMFKECWVLSPEITMPFNLFYSDCLFCYAEVFVIFCVPYSCLDVDGQRRGLILPHSFIC